MAMKHGFCPSSNKRNFGKGRKKEAKTRVVCFRHMGGDESSYTWHQRKYRTLNQATECFTHGPSAKCVKRNRRRARKKVRLSVLVEQQKLEQMNAAKKCEVEKMKKLHAKNVRQMQKRFLRDIHELWKKQHDLMYALENSV
jgi:hypothetical protein